MNYATYYRTYGYRTWRFIETRSAQAAASERSITGGNGLEPETTTCRTTR